MKAAITITTTTTITQAKVRIFFGFVDTLKLEKALLVIHKMLMRFKRCA